MRPKPVEASHGFEWGSLELFVLDVVPAGSPSVCCRLDLGILQPCGAVGITAEVERLGGDFDAVSGGLGKQIAATTNAHRIDEVFVQMIDVLDHSILKGSGDADKVECG